MIMALLLINICSFIKCNRGSCGNLKNILLIDEAHVLLGGKERSGNFDGTPDAQGTTVKAIQDMIAEIRSYGTGIIIADQSPAKVSREIVAQTEIKVAFRLVQSLDKELIADTTNMDDEARQQLSKLNSGEAFVYYSKLDSAVLVMTPDIRKERGILLSVPNTEIRERMSYWNSRQKELRPYHECRFCAECRENCDFKIRADADFYAKQLSDACSKRVKDNSDLLRYVMSVEKLLLRLVKRSEEIQNFTRLMQCVRIKFCRNIQLNTPYRVSRVDLERILQHSAMKDESAKYIVE